MEKDTSVMKAAQNLGIDIPNLCWNDELEHFTSCMLCLVKDNKNGKLFPSCSVKVAEGMEIITDDKEISQARKIALELLLSDHVGDCEAPCHIACPAHMNIPLMNRLIAASKFDEALEVVKRDIVMPAVLGRICPAPCEGACHRKTLDEPVSICLLKRFVGDEGAVPKIRHAEITDQKVAVIGAGPAGLAAGYYMQLRGIDVTLFDKSDKPGGQLRTEINEDILPREVLDKEIEFIFETGVKFEGCTEVDNILFKELQRKFHVIVISTGTIGDDTNNFGLKSTSKGIIV